MDNTNQQALGMSGDETGPISLPYQQICSGETVHNVVKLESAQDLFLLLGGHSQSTDFIVTIFSLI